jgi:plastocyanin
MRRPTLLLAISLALLTAAGCGSGATKTLTYGSTSFNSHGTQSAAGKSTLALEVDNYYFSPTFLKGNPGQTLTVTINNDSGTEHNFSIAGQPIDTDIEAKGKASVTVTFPASGVLAFFCKYHSGKGMNGELLSGDAQPQAPAGSSETQTKPTSPPAYRGGY